MVEIASISLGCLAGMILLALMWSYTSELLHGGGRRASRLLAGDRTHTVATDLRVRRAKSEITDNLRRARDDRSRL